MIKSKTGEPGCFEVTETTRLSLERWISTPEMIGVKFPWSSRIHRCPRLSTVSMRVSSGAGSPRTAWSLAPFCTHSMRRAKVARIYKKTDDLRAVQLLLGHTKMDSTVRHLGVAIEDALTLL